MPDSKLLQADLEQSVTRAQELAGKSNRSDAENNELTMLHERAMKLQVAVKEAVDTERKADLNGLTEFLNSPNYKTNRAVNDDPDGKKHMHDIGWEFKGGKVFIPTSTGKSIEMYNEEVLFGPIPDATNDDSAADAAAYFRKTRAIIQPKYRQAYTKWLRLSSKVRSEALALMQLSGEEQKALSEGIDGSGGYLVPPDLQAEVLVRTAQMSVMRRLARIITTSRDHVDWPRVLPNSDSTLESIYSSGFVGGWVGETPAFSETDPGFGKFSVSIKKLRVATKLSNDFINDAVIDILAWLAQNGAENMALTEDAGFITGDGTALQPLGFLNDADLKTADVEGSGSDTISNTVSAAGSYPKLVALTYALPSQYAARAEWLMRRAIEGDIRALVDSSGRPLWLGQNESGFDPHVRSLMGGRVNNSEWMPNDGVNGNKVVAYGDFSSYIIAQRAQMSTVVLRERFADTDQTGIIIFERVGGGLWNNDALRVGTV
jgi:HK97 family phage major capsid protein